MVTLCCLFVFINIICTVFTLMFVFCFVFAVVGIVMFGLSVVYCLGFVLFDVLLFGFCVVRVSCYLLEYPTPSTNLSGCVRGLGTLCDCVCVVCICLYGVLCFVWLISSIIVGGS